MKQNIPNRLWDYCLVHIVKTMTQPARGKDWRTPHEEVTGDTPDILQYVDFQIYDWVWYWDVPGADDNPNIGRWLGVSHRIGATMCYYILTGTCVVISRTTVQHIMDAECVKATTAQQMNSFTKIVDTRLADDKFWIPATGENTFYLEDELSEEMATVEMEEDPGIPEANEFSGEAYNEYIGAQLIPPTGEGHIWG